MVISLSITKGVSNEYNPEVNSTTSPESASIRTFSKDLPEVLTL